MSHKVSKNVSPIILVFAAGFTVGVSAVKLFGIWQGMQSSAAAAAADKLDQARARLRTIVGESFTGALILTGDLLGIYEILFHSGPITPSALARKTGWSERWLQEWLCQSTAAGICSYCEKTNEFLLKLEYAKLLRDPTKSKDSLVGLFTVSNALQTRASATAHAIKTGIGVDYDYGDDIIVGMDRKNWNYFQNHFIDEIIVGTRIPGTGKSLVELLEKGIEVADVGCGCGASTVAMARRFPKSRFYAYELSPRSLDAMRKRVSLTKLDNIVVCDVGTRSVGEGPDSPDADFGFVYVHDVMHDMARPRDLIKQVRNVLSPDGCWVIVDVMCGSNTAENLRMSSAKTNLGFSCLLCLSSATSLPDGEGLGTMGFNIELATKWMKDAGFKHCVPFSIPSLPENQAFVVS